MGAGDHPMNVGQDVITSTEPWVTEYVERISNYNGQIPYHPVAGPKMTQVSDQ